MSTASIPASERARNLSSTVLKSVQDPGRQAAIAVAMGVSESTISRLKNEHLDTLCGILAHAGLKIVPVEMKCFPPEKIDALLTLAKAHLASIENADELVWEDGSGVRR